MKKKVTKVAITLGMFFQMIIYTSSDESKSKTKTSEIKNQNPLSDVVQDKKPLVLLGTIGTNRPQYQGMKDMIGIQFYYDLPNNNEGEIIWFNLSHEHYKAVKSLDFKKVIRYNPYIGVSELYESNGSLKNKDFKYTIKFYTDNMAESKKSKIFIPTLEEKYAIRVKFDEYQKEASFSMNRERYLLRGRQSRVHNLGDFKKINTYNIARDSIFSVYDPKGNIIDKKFNENYSAGKIKLV